MDLTLLLARNGLMEAFTAPHGFFNFSFLPKYLVYFGQGVVYTLLLSVVSVAVAVIPALCLALMRLSKNKLVRGLSGAYIAVFRSTPMLVQLYIIYYGLFGVGGIQLPNVYILGYINLAQFIPGVVALAMNSSAYVAEIFRGGILAVDKGQMEGARSCGMTNAQAMRYVVMPQAVKNILPAIGNEFVTMVKETSIIQYLGIGDLMYNNGIVVTSTYNPLPCYYISAIIYLALNIILGKGLNIFEGRLRKSER